MTKQQSSALTRALARLKTGDETAFVKLLTSEKPEESLSAFAELLRGSPDHAETAVKIDGCTPHRRCHQRFCPTCAVLPHNHLQRMKEMTRQVQLGEASSRSHDPQVRAAQLVQSFYLFDQTEIFFVTLNLGATAVGDLAKMIKSWRSRLRQKFRKVAPDLVVKGRFEFDQVFAGDLPAAHLIDAASVQGYERQAPVYKLHLHALMHARGFTGQELRESLLRALHCEDRGTAINVRGLRDEHVLGGINVKGLEGVARYYAKEFTSLSKVQDLRLDEYRTIIFEIADQPRASLNFSLNTSGRSRPETRARARWIEAVRHAEGLGRSASVAEVEAFLLEKDIDQLFYQVHPKDIEAFKYQQIEKNLADRDLCLQYK